MAGLQGTVSLPGIGEMKKAHVAAACGVAGGVVVFAYVRRARDSAAADPAAGEEPTATEGDYNAGGDPYGSLDGLDSYVNPAPALVGQYNPPDPETLPPATNAAWTSRAIDRLAEVGYDPKAVSAALGRYLSRTAPTSQTEVTIIQTALAVLGPPPSGTYSLLAVPAKTSTSPSTPTTTKPTTSTTTKPTSSGTTKTKPKTGIYVTVRRWRKVNPPWQSTIGGIARHYGRRPEVVWSHPKNAGLRARRKSMTAIQPGDRVYVVPR